MRRPTRVSIVTPCYNAERFLRATIDSVLNQDAGGRLADAGVDLEYIIQDACSDDGSGAILDDARSRGATVVRERDGGQSDAIAKGFGRASGEILAWINADDVYAPGAVAYALKYFREHPQVELIYSHRTFIDEAGIVTGHWLLPRHRRIPQEIRAMIPQETCFWRRSLMDRAGGIDPSYSFAFDHEFFVRMMRAGAAVRLDAWLASFRVHPDAKTSREYQTTGRSELARIAARHGVPTGPAAQLRGRLFKERVRLTSMLSTKQPADPDAPRRVKRGERFVTPGVRAPDQDLSP